MNKFSAFWKNDIPKATDFLQVERSVEVLTVAEPHQKRNVQSYSNCRTIV